MQGCIKGRALGFLPLGEMQCCFTHHERRLENDSRLEFSQLIAATQRALSTRSNCLYAKYPCSACVSRRLNLRPTTCFKTAQEHARTTTRNARGTITRSVLVCLLLRAQHSQQAPKSLLSNTFQNSAEACKNNCKNTRNARSRLLAAAASRTHAGAQIMAKQHVSIQCKNTHEQLQETHTEQIQEVRLSACCCECRARKQAPKSLLSNACNNKCKKGTRLLSVANCTEGVGAGRTPQRTGLGMRELSASPPPTAGDVTTAGWQHRQGAGW